MWTRYAHPEPKIKIVSSKENVNNTDTYLNGGSGGGGSRLSIIKED